MSLDEQFRLHYFCQRCANCDPSECVVSCWPVAAGAVGVAVKGDDAGVVDEPVDGGLR